MQASIFNATERFFAPVQMILKIPVYQRNYDWNKNNVKRLLDDLYTVIKTKKQHFLGAVVYLESTNSDIGLPEYLIIDGQQRLRDCQFFCVNKSFRLIDSLTVF